MTVLHCRAGHSLASTILLLLATLLLFARADAARAAAVGGNCSVNTIAYRESDDSFVTSSTDPVSITGMASSFTLAAPGCVVVQFTAYATTDTGTNASYITFDLDGTAKNQLFADRLPVGRTALVTVVYIFRNVTAGAHLLKVKLQSSDGTQVQANGPKTVLVHYRK